MIKRLTAVVIAALMALIPLSGMAANDSRQLTLMIYMCGSNLESGYGAATADMQEMMASGFDAKKMTVLVMTGGSEAWAQGFDAGQAMIHELGNNRSRTVWSESAMDMGDSATLRSFLRFGQERYPARRYALILWNHGCGPLDGVCLDELFGMDSLSLRELSQGLADAELGQKLSFIGFDACLMGSLEVACAVSPYAEYMIASQETEPASGWPYGFLPGLVDDETGADTGRRLCDMYMASDVLPGEMLTLSCLDLGKAEAAAAALGEYFSSYTEGWNESLFTRTSALRAASVGYGEGLKGMGDGGYDLVDLGDFTAYLEAAGLGGDELSAALDELVVYSRSSGDVGQGLSLYHPMFNKAQYQAAWREEYRQLGFSESYTAYTERFADMLLSDSMTDWTGLSMDLPTADDAGRQTFSAELTEEQARHFDSAELLILMDTEVSENGAPLYALVSSIPAALEGRTLSATYGGRALYARSEDGSLEGPLSFVAARDGKSDVVFAVYIPNEGNMGSDGTSIVQYWLDRNNPESPVSEVKVQDDATGEYTNRIAFSEEGYRTVIFWNIIRLLPGAGEGGTLPAFNDWNLSQDYSMGSMMDLDDAWRFDYEEDTLSGVRLWAVFQVTDTQQNTYCTQPAPVPNPHVRGIPVTGGLETDLLSASMKAELDTSQQSPGLRLRFTFENKTETEASFQLENMILNNTRLAVRFSGSRERAPAQGTVEMTVDVSPEDMTYLESVESLSVTLNRFPDADSYFESEPYALSFRLEDCDVRDIAPMPDPAALTEQDGLTLSLLSVEPEYKTIKANLYASNQRDEDWSFGNYNLINGSLLVRTNASLPSNTLPAGADAVFTVRFDRALNFSKWDLTMNEADDSLVTYYMHDLPSFMGFSAVESLQILSSIGYYDSDLRETVALIPEEPLPMPSPDVNDQSVFFAPKPLMDQAQGSVELLHDDALALTCEAMLAGENGVALALTVTNPKGSPVEVLFKDFRIGQQAVRADFYDEFTRMIPPKAAFPMLLILGAQDDLASGTPADRVSLTVSSDGVERSVSVSVQGDVKAVTGIEGGLVVGADSLTAD